MPRPYSEDPDQVREVLVHAHYIWQNDIEICAAYDLTPHAVNPNYAAMETLHRTLREAYTETDFAAP